MNKNLELAQDKLMERIRNICNKFGFNSFVAQLFVVLYFSKEPLSLDELTKRLNSSKGNVSINIRILESWGAVRNIWIKGSRKDFYEAELDIKKVFLNKVKISLRKNLSEAQEILDEFKNAFGEATSELTDEEKEISKVYQDRLNKIQELNDLASMVLQFSDKLL